MFPRLRLLSILVASIALVACEDDAARSGSAAVGAGGSAASDGTAGSTSIVCARGDTRQCFGPGACEGAQACLPDGTGWEDCDCGRARSATGSTANASGGDDTSGVAGDSTGDSGGAGGSRSSGSAGAHVGTTGGDDGTSGTTTAKGGDGVGGLRAGDGGTSSTGGSVSDSGGAAGFSGSGATSDVEESGGSAGSPAPSCYYRVEPGGTPLWPAMGQTEDCDICIHESCESLDYHCGEIIDPCGTPRTCGDAPFNDGTSELCSDQSPVKWSCGGEPFALPDPRCNAHDDPSSGYYVCCPGAAVEPVPEDRRWLTHPFEPVLDNDCETPTTYYLDADGDGAGGLVSVDACYPPNSTLNSSDHPLLAGIWVTEGGDCYDNDERVRVGSSTSYLPFTTPFFPQWSPIPLFDYDCSGAEEGPSDAWRGVATTCGTNCLGSGFADTSRRAPGVEGVNSLCGGIEYECRVVYGACVGVETGELGGCL